MVRARTPGPLLLKGPLPGRASLRQASWKDLPRVGGIGSPPSDHHGICFSSRVPKDPSKYASIEELRRELELSKGQAPFTITKTIKWLSDSINNGGGSLGYRAFAWVFGMNTSTQWKRPQDIDTAALVQVEAETDPALLNQLQILLLIPRNAALKLLHRCPDVAKLSSHELMQRIVELKALFPTSNVARMIELLPSAFIACPWQETLERLGHVNEHLRHGLPGVDVDRMVELDPTILFEDPKSIQVGIQRLHELWKVDASALANSEPEELALAVRALSLGGPPDSV
jgi:hypothetical protein